MKALVLVAVLAVMGTHTYPHPLSPAVSNESASI